MKTHTYKKYTEVYSDLKTLINEKICAGELFLPSEVPLSKQLNASRMTLRKALELADMDGLIERVNETKRKTRVNRIANRKPDLRKCGTILFIATGIHGHIILPAMENIYLKLAAEILPLNADLRLLIFPYAAEKNIQDEFYKQLETEISKAKVVLFTVKDSRLFFEKRCMDIIRKYDTFPRTYIKLSEGAEDLCENYICLDERGVGVRAAESLLRAGCKLPAVVASAHSFEEKKSIFYMRYHGFEQACLKHGVTPYIVKMANENHALSEHERLWEAWNRGECDGAFLISDESSAIVFFNFFQNNLVPEKFRVITLNATGQALNHNPPLTALSHAATGIVKELLAWFISKASGTEERVIRIRVKPELLPNQTVSKEEASWVL